MTEDTIPDIGPDPAAFTVVGRRTPRPKPKGQGDPVITRRNRNNRRRGTSAEREWAKIVGGIRVGVLGREDIDDGYRAWEVKARLLPTWLREAVVQARLNAGRRIPAVAVRCARQGAKAKWYVVLDAQIFLDLFGEGERRE